MAFIECIWRLSVYRGDPETTHRFKTSLHMPMAPPKKSNDATPTRPEAEKVVAPVDPEPPEAEVEGAETEPPAEAEIVAVGTVSHVLRRAFHQFYTHTDPVPTPPHQETNEATESEMPTDDSPLAHLSPHPFVAIGTARKHVLRDSLALTHTTAAALLTFLDERYSAAAAQDEAIAADLARQGLVVRAQIPMGPSNLRLDPDELAPFGAFGTTLIHAKTLVGNYRTDRLVKSGNGPTCLARKVAAIAREPPGYLGTTSSYDVRKETTLEVHEEHIQTVKAMTKDTRSTDPTDRFDPHVNEMPAHEKRKNLAILERMQTKLSFLRNPRYAPESDTVFFVAVPSPVAFTDYDVGGVYEQTLVVRNASSLSRRMRVLPPASIYFSIAEITFPDASGLVAPGMHVHVTLRFAPDSRAEYKDVVMVQHEGGEFPVPIHARRPPPELSIPLLLRTKPTLVGTQSVTTIQCTNTGGKARFWLLSERDWARCESTSPFQTGNAIGTVLREFQAQGGVRVGPFTISPSEIELDCGDSIPLQLTFLPSGVGEQRDKIVMVCDNCLVRVFQLVGRGCQVDLSVAVLNDHIIDRSIACMGRGTELVFPRALRLHATAIQQFTLANDTPIELPFAWRFASSSNDADCPFRITPAMGVLPASDSTAFRVEFSPRKPQRFNCWFVVLDLNNVLACCVPGPMQRTLITETYERLHIELQLQRLGDALIPLTAAETAVEGLRLSLDGTGRLGSFHLDPTVLCLGTESLTLGQSYQLKTRISNDGDDAPLVVRWDPSLALATPRDHLFSLSIEPAELSLAPQSSIDAVLSFTPLKAGRFSVAIPCTIVESTHVRWLRVEGSVAPPQLRIVSPEVDFGLVLASASADTIVTLTNDSPVAAGDWTLVHLEASTDPTPLHHANSTDSLASRASGGGHSTNRSSTGSLAFGSGREFVPRASISFSPSTGFLAPKETVDVHVTCHAGSLPERFRGTFALNTTSCVSARAEIQRPNVFLTPLRLALGPTFLSVGIERTLHLVNVSNLEAKFQFMEPQGPSPACSIEFAPSRGVLRAKESLNVVLRYTPRQAGKTTTLIACAVQGLGAPLGLEVVATHKGLVLTYEVLPLEGPVPTAYRVPDGELETDSPPLVHAIPRLQFGDAVPLAQRRSLRLVVRNLSGIDAHLELTPKQFPVAVLPETVASTAKDKSDAKDALRRFQSTNGRAYIRVQDHTQQDRQLLSRGRGVAFLVSTSCQSLTPLGVLRIPAWDLAVVYVTCFNDLPGVYHDVLSCRALGLPPVLLPMHATVVGSPLAFDSACVGLHLPHISVSTPTFTIGAVGVRTSPVTSTLRVQNRGPRPATLAWRLVDHTQPPHLVDVTLRVDWAARVNLRIVPRTSTTIDVPFAIVPPSIMQLAPFASASIGITFFPTEHATTARAMLVAHTHWTDEDDKIEGDSRCETTVSSITPFNRLTTAAGKAIQAVRVANSLIKAPSPHSTSGAAPTLRVLLRANAVEPELSLDQVRRVPSAPYHIKFTTWSTLLSNPDAVSRHVFHRREFSLVNRSRARLTFRLEATGPFAVTRAESLAPRHPLATADLPPAHRRADGESFLFTLPPQLGVRVELSIDVARLAVALGPPSTGLLRRVDGELFVRFTNQSIQTLRLACDVLRPQLVVSPATYRFGHVYLSQSRRVILRVANPTTVPASYTMRHVPRPTPLSPAQQFEKAKHDAQFVDEPSVFTFGMERGVVRGPTVSLRSAGGAPQPTGHSTRDLYDGTIVFAPLEIHVTFRPRAIGTRYQSRFRLCVADGVDYDVVLEGQGHLDEVEHRDQDRPMVRTKELTHQTLMFKTLPT